MTIATRKWIYYTALFLFFSCGVVSLMFMRRDHYDTSIAALLGAMVARVVAWAVGPEMRPRQRWVWRSSRW